jgi:hypothetical protein
VASCAGRTAVAEASAAASATTLIFAKYTAFSGLWPD